MKLTNLTDKVIDAYRVLKATMAPWKRKHVGDASPGIPVGSRPWRFQSPAPGSSASHAAPGETRLDPSQKLE
jgi:hypothetical protein